MVLQKPFIFILGAPRSGTTWLQLLLANHPQVCSSVELRLVSHYIASWREHWAHEAGHVNAQGGFYFGLPVVWTRTEFDDFCREFLERVYNRVWATKPEATHVLDKFPGNGPHIDAIKEFFPQAKFVHIIRDGRDVAVSMNAARDEIGYPMGGPMRTLGQRWSKHVRASRQASKWPDSYHELRYEELLAKPEAELKRVYEFCGLPAGDDLVSSVVEANRIDKLRKSRTMPATGVKAPEGHFRKGEAGGWKSAMTAMDRRAFARTANSLLLELGYVKDPEWWADNSLQKVYLSSLEQSSEASFRVRDLARRVASKRKSS